METVGSWAFVLGPVSGFLSLPVAWTLNNSASSVRDKRAMSVLAVLSGVLVVAHSVVWWFSFDYYQGESHPNDLFAVSTVLMYASALACLSAVVAAGVLWFRSRRSLSSVS